MKIRLAKTAGFCMGVRRAVEMALDLQRSRLGCPIVTYGPLIHNPQTLELLESKGIQEVDSIDRIQEGTVVIRAHGVSPQERRILQEKGIGIVDATCPRVQMVQAIIRKHAANGDFCVIVGDKDHPEVRGLIGFASAGAMAIASPNERWLIDTLSPARGICVVAQTTQQVETFNRVVEMIKVKCQKLHVYDTICDSTKKRQREVSRLARQVDLVVVVGGKGSGNTQRLVEVARSQGTRALHVETADAIPPSALTGANTVGVTAGASTPNWQIQRVIDRLRQVGMSRAAGPLRGLRRLADMAVMTYLWTAVGGGGLTAACLTLQGREVTWPPLAAAMLFVFSMHLLHRILDRSGAVRFNTPEIAAFYSRNRTTLTALGILSTAGALAIGLKIGLGTFLLLAGMITAGLLYTVPLRLDLWLPSRRWESLKEIPGSKTPLVALGWAMAAAVVPAVGSSEVAPSAGLVVSFLFAAAMVFWRTALSDLLDIQGDRIVGRETIPILIGVSKSKKLLLALLVFLAGLPVLSAALGWTSTLGYWLVANAIIFGVCFVIYRTGRIVDRLSFDGMLDGNLLLAGGLAMLYGII